MTIVNLVSNSFLQDWLIVHGGNKQIFYLRFLTQLTLDLHCDKQLSEHRYHWNNTQISCLILQELPLAAYTQITIDHVFSVWMWWHPVTFRHLMHLMHMQISLLSLCCLPEEVLATCDGKLSGATEILMILKVFFKWRQLMYRNRPVCVNNKMIKLIWKKKFNWLNKMNNEIKSVHLT